MSEQIVPGQFANISGCPWINKSPKKSRKKAQIVYPNFFEYVEATNNDFWKEIFIGMAYGKIPRGFSVRDYIFYRRGSKCYKIGLKEPVDAIIDFFQRYGGIHHMQDTQEESCASVSHPESWAKATKRQKDMYIEFYAEDEIARRELGFKEYCQLVRLLNMASIVGNLDSRVTFENGNITSIDGLKFEFGSFSLEKCAKKKARVVKRREETQDVTEAILQASDELTNAWDNLLREYMKVHRIQETSVEQ